ncbi:MAG: hypothetical protein M3081_12630 [Gemmatimonadota bacterium]|nr:hypothetical protein [Gemmatimonadota bacterium]
MARYACLHRNPEFQVIQQRVFTRLNSIKSGRAEPGEAAVLARFLDQGKHFHTDDDSGWLSIDEHDDGLVTRAFEGLLRTARSSLIVATAAPASIVNINALLCIVSVRKYGR